MKKLIALAVIALALPITVSAASAVKEHQTIPSLLSGRVIVEEQEQQTTGFAMENPEVWYEEPVEIADNSDSTSSDSSNNDSGSSGSNSSSGSNESYSEPVAEEPAPEPAPTPAPEPSSDDIPPVTTNCEYCGGAHATYEEYGACAHYNTFNTCQWCDFQYRVSDSGALMQHLCQAHGGHLASGSEWICEYCGNTIGADGGVINQESDLPFLEDE